MPSAPRRLRWSGCLAEGATGPFFDLFVLLANPNATDAQAEVHFLLPDGREVVRTKTIPANSRSNIWVDLEAPELADTAVSTSVRSTNGVPLLVERAMWWPGDATTWYEAHASAGVTSAATRWALAEGETGGPHGASPYVRDRRMPEQVPHLRRRHAVLHQARRVLCRSRVFEIGTERNQVGVVGATVNSLGSLAAMVNPLIVAYSVQWFGSWNVPLYLMGVLS